MTIERPKAGSATSTPIASSSRLGNQAQKPTSHALRLWLYAAPSVAAAPLTDAEYHGRKLLMKASSPTIARTRSERPSFVRSMYPSSLRADRRQRAALQSVAGCLTSTASSQVPIVAESEPCP